MREEGSDSNLGNNWVQRIRKQIQRLRQGREPEGHGNASREEVSLALSNATGSLRAMMTVDTHCM